MASCSMRFAVLISMALSSSGSGQKCNFFNKFSESDELFCHVTVMAVMGSPMTSESCSWLMHDTPLVSPFLSKTTLLHEHSGGGPTTTPQFFGNSCMNFLIPGPTEFLFNFRVRSWKSFLSIFSFFRNGTRQHLCHTYIDSLFSPVTLARRRITNTRMLPHGPSSFHSYTIVTSVRRRDETKRHKAMRP